MRKPRLNEEGLTEELGAVASFALRARMPQVEPVAAAPLATAEAEPIHEAVATPAPPDAHRETIQPPVRPPARADARPYARTGRQRRITRYAFEFYQDQIEQLQEFSLAEKHRGEKGSMSQMVREAIDSYI